MRRRRKLLGFGRHLASEDQRHSQRGRRRGKKTNNSNTHTGHCQIHIDSAHTREDLKRETAPKGISRGGRRGRECTNIDKKSLSSFSLQKRACLVQQNDQSLAHCLCSSRGFPNPDNCSLAVRKFPPSAGIRTNGSILKPRVKLSIRHMVKIRCPRAIEQTQIERTLLATTPRASLEKKKLGIGNILLWARLLQKFSFFLLLEVFSVSLSIVLNV